MSRRIAIAYIPVLHQGYIRFLEEIATQQVNTLFVVGDQVLASQDSLDYLNRKDRLRAVASATLLPALRTVTDISLQELTPAKLQELQQEGALHIYTPKEDIGREIVDTYFDTAQVTYIDIFLRWHRDNTGEEKAVEAHTTVSLSDFQKEIFADVCHEASNAVDWWRQVGAALVKDSQVLFVTHNEHMPEKELPNILGDARALFKRGVHINYSTAAHAEVVAIAQAAKRGIATEGAQLYVTDFPCPYCARLIAKSGITKLFFLKGYAVLEGDTFLKEEGVEVLRVALDA